MLMILSMEPGFGSVMTMSHDDWLLKCDHRTVTGYDVTRNTNHMHAVTFGQRLNGMWKYKRAKCKHRKNESCVLL
jgi:hypothetical protein